MADTNENPTRLHAVYESLTLRSIVIVVLALVMLIPLGLVGNVVGERDHRYRMVLSDIANTWGEAQTLLAPVLVVPFTDTPYYEEKVTDGDGNTRLIQRESQHRRTAYFLPDELEIDVQMVDEVRRRGIFESLVYRATVLIDAEFGELDVDSLSADISQIHWDQAWLSIGLSDTRAINSVDLFQWGDSPRELAPGTRLHSLPSGFHAPLDKLSTESTDDAHTLRLAMNVNGSGAFQFAPFGQTTTVSMSSSWPHPSFQGDALPDQRDIGAGGFTAVWTLPHLARNYPQRWSSER